MIFFPKKRLPVIYQSVNAECGLACIAMVLGYHGRAIDLNTLRERSQASTRGMALNELLRIAGLMQLEGRVVQVEPETLYRLRAPAILHWDLSHFVVLKAVKRGRCYLHDPDLGEIVLPLHAVGRHLSGIAIEMTPSADFAPGDERAVMRVSDLSLRMRQYMGNFIALAMLAVLSQALVLVIPYFSQIIIDRLVPQGDIALLHYVLMADAMQSDFKVNAAKANFALARDSLMTLENVVALVIGAQLVISGTLSLGMMFAFFAYKRLLVASCLSLTETFFKARILSVQLDRLSDIVRSSQEPASDADMALGANLPIEIKQSGMRYPGNAQAAFENISFKVAPGERIVLCGPSGSGKTSFLKVLLQLFPQQQGEIYVGDKRLADIARPSWLANIGVVMQNDQLFSASIRENIAFGAEEIDDLAVREAARLACVLDDIESLPMRFETRVMELGAGMSAGQIQRIVIARALYKRPGLLLMDEGTANLDQALEAQVLCNIRQLGMTVIQAAHRPQIIADATQVIYFQPQRNRQP